MTCPTDGRYYSGNLGSASEWSPRTRTYITGLGESGERDGGFSLRYAGALAADIHRTLLEGGIYFYPADRKHPDGKLRLLYECAPLAFVLEQAGGAASTGQRRVLGRMGGNMVRRLMRGGHPTVVFDLNTDAVSALDEFVRTLKSTSPEAEGRAWASVGSP
jgi:fructose-1,6-bisphosphatase